MPDGPGIARRNAGDAHRQFLVGDLGVSVRPGICPRTTDSVPGSTVASHQRKKFPRWLSNLLPTRLQPVGVRLLVALFVSFLTLRSEIL